MIEARPGTIVTLDTRGEAEEKVDKKKRYRQIIQVMMEKGNMTAKEVAVEMYNKGMIPSMERNYSAPRLTELSKKGLVEPIGKKRCEWTGKMVAVYRLRIGPLNILEGIYD